MERHETFRKVGLGMAMAGLAVALLSVVPSISSREAFPWALMVGAAIYLPGAFLLVFGTKGEDRKAAIGKLRFVRLGFIAVFAFVIFRMMSG